MRITQRQLRQIIREELTRDLDEMAWAGNLGAQQGAGRLNSFIGAEFSPKGPNPQAAARYAQGGRFASLAEKHFKHIPFPVWTAAVVGTRDDVTDRPRAIQQGVPRPRVKILDLHPEGVQELASQGFSDLSNIDQDDLVILYTTMSAVKNFMASPWTIIHSIFDSDQVRKISSLYADLRYCMAYDDWRRFPDLSPLTYDFGTPQWVSGLTMSSARNGEINSGLDALSEIVCQELITESGFRFNPDAVSLREAEALMGLKSYITRVADEFRQNARGKLIIVAVN